MARMPGAIWQGEHGSRSMDRYDIVCVHTIVGWAPAHAAHFSVKLDGTILQSRDTRFRSAANLDGNYRIIAIENEDGGNWQEPLTPEQVESNARILAWAHETHGVPLQLCPDSRPTSRGLAYHRQGIDGNFGSYRFPGRVSGGEVWTSSRGKVCPGDNKIAQRPAILKQAKNLNNPKEWTDVATKKEFKEIVDAAVAPLLTAERFQKYAKNELNRDKRAKARDRKIMALLKDVPAETLEAVIEAVHDADEPAPE